MASPAWPPPTTSVSILSTAIAGSDTRDHPEALVVVLGHLIDEVDFPGEVLAHRFLAAHAALARREHDIDRLAGHMTRPGFDRQAGLRPRRGAALENQDRPGR